MTIFYAVTVSDVLTLTETGQSQVVWAEDRKTQKEYFISSVCLNSILSQLPRALLEDRAHWIGKQR